MKNWKLLPALLPTLLLLLATAARAQSLSGNWQGVETDDDEPGSYWPAELRLQQNQTGGLFGILYHEVGNDPDVTVTFRVRGTRTPTGLRLEHGPKLQETGQSLFSYWCAGSLVLSYDAAQEKLTGHAAYRPLYDCTTGNFVLYRVRLKSAATVPAGATTIRVSGRDVSWYADATSQQVLASGNSYRTRLRQTTTFYVAQAYYATPQSTRVPITVRVVSGAPAAVSRPALSPADTARLAPIGPGSMRLAVPALRPPTQPAPVQPEPLLAGTPVVLPTVLFRLGTDKLLAEGLPALNQLAATLRTHPEVGIEVAGHTDRIGKPSKNQVLSEQRAAAVRKYLVRAGIAAARIRPIGYGDTRPLYPSPDARNRRVEVQVVE